MLTEEQIERKIYDLPMLFERLFAQKEMQKAHFLREDAARIALFLEFPEKKMDELFGSKQDLDNIIEGKFKEYMCMKAFDWCVFHNATYDAITFDDVNRLLWAKKEAPGIGLLGA